VAARGVCPLFGLLHRDHADVLRPQTRVEIAAKLVISPKTVGSHLQRILAKLGVHSCAHAIALAYQAGLLTSSEAQREDTVVG
jgi:Bacterial regulatory proteins, luxR family